MCHSCAYISNVYASLMFIRLWSSHIFDLHMCLTLMCLSSSYVWWCQDDRTPHVYIVGCQDDRDLYLILSFVYLRSSPVFDVNVSLTFICLVMSTRERSLSDSILCEWHMYMRGMWTWDLYVILSCVSSRRHVMSRRRILSCLIFSCRHDGALFTREERRYTRRETLHEKRDITREERHYTRRVLSLM